MMREKSNFPFGGSCLDSCSGKIVLLTFLNIYLIIIILKSIRSDSNQIHGTKHTEY